MILNHALAYTKRGWRVFPLVPRDKTPLTKNGFHQATDDRDTITRWWEKWPDANIGIATGAGLLVVDIDNHESWRRVAHPNGTYHPQTLICITGSGGLHAYYRAPAFACKTTASKIAPKIDTRGTGGYVVAPPSVHPSGGVYEWAPANLYEHRREPQPAPRWLLRIIAGHVTTTPPKINPPAPYTGGVAFGDQVLADSLARIRRAPEGQRNHEASAAAWHVQRAITGGNLPQGVMQLVADACLEIGLTTTETENLVKHAIAKGATRPYPNFAPRIAAPRISPPRLKKAAT